MTKLTCFILVVAFCSYVVADGITAAPASSAAPARAPAADPPINNIKNEAHNSVVSVCELTLKTEISAVLETLQRIVGGSVTTIEQYPSMAAVLFSRDSVTFSLHCGGTILNTRSILSAAHCILDDVAKRWLVRVGSSFANSGGVVHSVQNIIIHPNYNPNTLDNDISMLRTTTSMSFKIGVSAVSISGSNYNIDAGQVVWAAGWGSTSYGAPESDQLRHVQMWIVDQSTCIQNYDAVGKVVTDNMLCSGWLEVGDHDQCQGNAGGALFLNGVQIGISSWGTGCAQPYYPGVNVRLSRYTSWINANA